MTERTRINVRLNGTAENPYHKFGLTANPFPRLRYELSHINRLLANLEAEPIKDEADLRQRLTGCSQEFIDGCVARFKPGEMVEFAIEFDF